MTARDFVPKKYQPHIIEHIMTHKRCGIWAGMGLGKTSSTLTALDNLSLTESDPILILAPLRVATSTWPNEVKKWKHLEHIEIVAAVGSVDQRRAALRKDAQIYTTNYDNLVWLVEHYGDRWPFKTVVADESTRLKSYRTRQGGKRAQALGKVAHTMCDRFIELTGTPAPNGLQDLWGQAWYLDKGQRLGRSYQAFSDRWFQSVQKGEDRFATVLNPLPFAQAQIEAAMSDICMSLDARDYFDIKEPIPIVRAFDLPAKAAKLYKDMEKEMFMEIKGEGVEAFSAASKTIKCLQLANGAAYMDETGRFAEVHDCKLQILDEIISEAAGMPVLVAYHFKSDLERLKKAFPKGRVLDKNPQTEKDWNDGKIPVLFAHPESAGHGLNLQDGGNILAFFGHWWALEPYLQIIERIGPTRQMQSGHNRPVFVYYIVARGTMDEVVMERRESKRTVQDLLMAAMKYKGVS